jgi:hypothetical protein
LERSILRCVTVPAPLFPDKIGTRAHEQNTKAQEGAATGAGTGAVLGGAFRWLIGIGARNPRARTLHCRRRSDRRPDWNGHTRVRGQG